jgi:hypothetical protein
MIFMLLVIAVQLVILTCSASSRLVQIRRAVIAASDLNLEAHQRLLEHLQRLDTTRPPITPHRS